VEVLDKMELHGALVVVQEVIETPTHLKILVANSSN
jgi:hypothetical protein